MLLFLFSIAPIVVFLILLLWLKWPLIWSSLIIFLITLLFSVFYWQILPVFLFNSFAKGTLVALDIFIIVTGAIFFLEILTKTKIIDHISFYLESFSKDYRVQVILLAWFFENFIEGTAGFGTPSALVAPLLIALGLQPLLAVSIALLGNSASVAFGAAGTPIRVGFAGLNIVNVPMYAAAINIVGFLVPVFMLWLLVAHKKDRKEQFFEALPFAIWSGLVFVVCSFATVFLGQEFPSILGSLLGLLIVFATTKMGIFVPKNIRSLGNVKVSVKTISFVKSLVPYGLLILLLIAGKFLLGSITIPIFGCVKYNYGLFNPGWAFILATLPVVIFWHNKKNLVRPAIVSALKRTIEPFFVIAFLATMVQIMINSGQNYSGIASSLDYLAHGVTSFLLPFWAPVIGSFGAFITGSATVSNVMFGDLLNVASQAMQMNGAKILALALVGGAAGNMVALADVLAATTVVGLKNSEHKVVKVVFPYCVIYILLAGVVGLLIV